MFHGPKTQAFEDLIAHADWLRKLAEQLARPSASADDALQETWAAAIRRPPRFQRSPRQWLAAVLRNFVRMEARSEGRRRAREADPVLEAPPTPATDALLERLELQQLLAAELAVLDEPFRTVVLLRFFEGHSSVEIAQGLRVPEGTVRWRLKEGLDRLRRRLDARYRGNRAAWVAVALPLSSLRPRTPPGPVTPLPESPLTRGLGPPKAAAVALCGAVAAVVWWIAADARTPALAPSEADQQGNRATRVAALSGLARRPAETLSADRDTFASGDLPIRATSRPVVPNTGVWLRGRVLDLHGAAVPRARVAATTMRFFDDSAAAAAEAVTSDEGKYALRLERGTYTVTVAAAGLVPARERVAVSRELARDFHLRPAARITGRVLDRSTRNPVAHADVYVRSLAGGDRTVRSDERGAFVFADLDGGGYDLVARKGPYAGMSPTVWVAPTNPPAMVDLEVDPVRAVSGRVLSPAGEGVEGAWVRLARENRPPELPILAQTGPGGVFRLEGVFPGHYRLRVDALKAAAAVRSLNVFGADLTGVEVRLTAGAVIAGRVVGVDGAAASGVTVRAETHGAAAFGAAPVSVESGEDGSFEIPELPEGRIVLSALGPGREVAWLDTLELAAGDRKEVTLRLQSGAEIVGAVRFDDGTPVAGATVVAGSGGRTSPAETTGPDGRFALGPLPAGTVYVSAARRGYPRPAARGEPPAGNVAGPEAGGTVSVAAGARVSYDIVLPGGGGVISGTARAPDGRPLAGVHLRVVHDRDGRQGWMANAPVAISQLDGTFRFEDLDRGTYSLLAFLPGYAEARLDEIRAEAMGLQVELAPEAVVAGTAVSRSGAPLPDYVLAVRPAHAAFPFRDGQIVRVHDPSGAFEVGQLGAGVYSVHVTTAEGRGGVATLSVGPGERRRGLRVVVDSDLKLLGRLVDRDTGAPLAGTSLFATVGGRITHARTDRSGGFEIEGALAGEPLVLSVAGDTRRHARERIETRVPPHASGVHNLGTFRVARPRVASPAL